MLYGVSVITVILGSLAALYAGAVFLTGEGVFHEISAIGAAILSVMLFSVTAFYDLLLRILLELQRRDR